MRDRVQGIEYKVFMRPLHSGLPRWAFMLCTLLWELYVGTRWRLHGTVEFMSPKPIAELRPIAAEFVRECS